jgi:hypothetical protein
MAMYSKADLEEELWMIDSLRAECNRLRVAGKITGFQFNTKRDELDVLERKARNKLLVTMLRLQDKQATEKNKIIVKQEGNQVYRRVAGEWVPTSEGELAYLEIKTGQEIYEEGRRSGAGVSLAVDHDTMAWQKVTRVEAQRLQKLGHTVRYGSGDDDSGVLG